MEGQDPTLDPDSSVYVAKWYGVRSGKCPGVYTDWKSASAQVIGWQKPKVKSFATREEAEAFVASGPGIASAPISEDRKSRKDTSKRDATTNSTAVKKRKTTTEVVETTVLEQDELSSDLEIEQALAAGLQQMEQQAQYQQQQQQLQQQQQQQYGTMEAQRSKKIKSSTTASARVPQQHSTAPPAPPAKKGTVLKIYTDGSSLSNGREEATAGVGVWFGSNDSRNISEPLHGPRQTNQRAELMAIYRAIEIAPKHREVLIFSDSQYAIHCVTLWHHNWSRNNWKTTLGKPVENKDIIMEVLKMIQEREEIGARTQFEWVKGHTGEADGNSMADFLAVEGARKGKAAAALAAAGVGRGR